MGQVAELVSTLVAPDDTTSVGRRLQQQVVTAVSSPAGGSGAPPMLSFAGWARAGNRSGAAVTAFIAKQRKWRAENADPSRLWQPCTSEYCTPEYCSAKPKYCNKATGCVGDKKKADCETWCRPVSKGPAHCRYCKCRACSACHNGSAACLSGHPDRMHDACRLVSVTNGIVCRRN